MLTRGRKSRPRCRILVTYDGQPMNDDWIGSSYVGYDALTDLGDVERIEVVRGPGSVRYGTNASSGVINVVSRNDAPPGVSAGFSTNQSRVARARVRADAKFGKDAGVWASVAAARGNGRDFRFPEYQSATSDGVARGVDGFESGTFRGHAYWKFLSAQWSMHSYDGQPRHEVLTALAGWLRLEIDDQRAEHFGDAGGLGGATARAVGAFAVGELRDLAEQQVAVRCMLDQRA
jgi:outer membrane cobalamin receptor